MEVSVDNSFAVVWIINLPLHIISMLKFKCWGKFVSSSLKQKLGLNFVSQLKHISTFNSPQIGRELIGPTN